MFIKNPVTSDEEYALKVFETRYRKLFETARDGILILDAVTGHINDVNPYLTNMLAYAKEEFLGKKLWETGAFKDIEASKEVFKELQDKEHIRYEDLPLKTKDGRKIAVEFVSNVYMVDNKKVIQCNIRDITERKQVEKILTESKQSYKTLSENLPAIVYRVHIKNNRQMQFFNEQLQTMTGYTPDDLTDGEVCSIDSFILNEDRDNVIQTVTNALRNRQSFEVEYRFRRKDGHIRYFCERGKPIYGVGGEPVYIDGVIFDITSRNLAEEQLKLDELRLESLLRISQHNAETVREFLDFALNEAIVLTKSKIGYIYFYDENKRQFTLNAWSKDEVKECSIYNSPTIYELDKTGIWGEAVRQRQPVIVNDFQVPHCLDRGYPEGHAMLYKYLTIPVFIADRIIAVVGVANKDTDYDQSDVRQLTLLMDAVWKYAEREKTEMALKESEQQYRSIFDNAVEGIFQTTPEGRYISVNPALARMIGYDSPEELMKGITDLSTQGYVNPEDRIMFKKTLEEQGTIKSFETQHYRKDGSTIWVLINARIVKDDAGKALYYEGTIEDITSRKHGEEQLRHERLRFSILSENAPFGMVMIDRDGKFIYINPKFKEIFGYDLSDIPDGRIWLKKAYPDPEYRHAVVSAWMEDLKGAKPGERGPRMYAVTCKDGTEKIINFIPVQLESGVIIISCDDITESKQLEEALRESEARLRTLSDNLPGGVVYQIDSGEDGQQCRFSYISAGVEQLHGIKVAEALNDAMTIYGQIVEEDRQMMAEREDLALANMTPFNAEVRIRLLSGEMRWVLFTSAPRRLPDHHLVWDGIEIDITPRKQAEKSLQQTLEKLRKSLAGTIQAMSLTVETRDPYTAGHQRRVSNLARAIAQEMGLSSDTVDNIRMAGIIHDIGKISIPVELLSKPTRLTDVEMSLIKVHSQSGYDILKDVDLPYPIAEIVLQHHEVLDGSGYPKGLKGDKILLEAKIICVADVVEAVASNRPYRPARGIEVALEEIEKNKGVLYDERVVEICLKLFREGGFKFE